MSGEKATNISFNRKPEEYRRPEVNPYLKL